VTTDTKQIGAFSVKDAGKGLVEAVFSTFNVKDKQGDWTLPGAFDGNGEVLIGAYGHRTWFGEPPVGKGVIESSEQDARLVAQFFVDSFAGKELFTVVKNLGPMQQWSYGYDVAETGELTAELEQRGVRRVLKKLLVHEISPVLVAAGIGTRTVATKCSGCGGSIEKGASCGCRAGSARMTDEQRAAVDLAIATHIATEADLKAGRPPGVTEVHATYLDPSNVALAEDALAAATNDLGLPAGLRVRFFSAKTDPERLGFFSHLVPGAIWVRSDRRGPALVSTIGHECWHVAEAMRGGRPDERAARAYGEKLMRSEWSCWPWTVQCRAYNEHGSRL